MTTHHARNPPTQEVVDRIARLLAQVDHESKHQLRYYLAGKTEWQFVLPIVRRRVAHLIKTRDRNIRREQRMELLEFAAEYGTRTRNEVADEPLTVRVQIRVTPTHMDMLKDAAKLQGMELTDWYRQTLVNEARKVIEDRP